MAPKKKNAFMFSINPDLYARSHQPSSTIAMGMKNSQASSLCWSAQVAREQKITEAWRAKNDPSGQHDTQQLAALERTLQRDVDKKQIYTSKDLNPEYNTYMVNNRTGGFAASHSAAAAAAPDSAFSLTGSSSPTKGTNASSGTKQQDASSAKTTTTTLPAVSSADAISQRKRVEHMRPSKRYLYARCDARCPAERFPDGPRTSSQVVGWQSQPLVHKNESIIINSKAVTARPQALVGAYHKPEDDDHALLFGYDYVPK